MHQPQLLFCLFSYIIQIVEQPTAREEGHLDNVSDFVSAINSSSSLGTVRMHTSVDFNFDVFRFLLGNKGKTPSKGKRLLYDE